MVVSTCTVPSSVSSPMSSKMQKPAHLSNHGAPTRTLLRIAFSFHSLPALVTVSKG